MPDPFIISAINTLGPEARIEGVGNLGPEAILAPKAPEATNFQGMLTEQLSKLNEVQASADLQAQKLASGQAQDITQVVIAAERAQMSLQLATQIRNQLVQGYQELLRTQI